MIVEVHALGHGMFTAWCDGMQIVGSSRQPFCDAARVLQGMGIDPHTQIVMRHQGSEVDCLISTVGEAAKWRVEERLRGSTASAPRFTRWVPVAGTHDDYPEEISSGGQSDTGEEVKRASDDTTAP